MKTVMEIPDLGPCCCCGTENYPATNIVMLDQKAPVKGTGWACLVCGLDPDGAVAVQCEKCMANGVEISMACHGYPAGRVRTKVSDLVGEHRHDEGKHAFEDLRMLRADADVAPLAETELMGWYGHGEKGDNDERREE
ncbi:MAG: hypothetical protein ACRDSJ_15420 [Rubrobacteraceae bacterium]